MTAYILTIGDEILIGQIVDTNAAWMAQQINLRGIRIAGKSSVADTHADIVASVAHALSKADLVLITGGLGATKDDITKKALADYFKVPMVWHQETFDRLSYFFGRLNRTVTEINKNGCFMPENAQILNNDVGLAPAMWFDIPASANGENAKVVVSMPGVPFEMQHLLSDRVLPRLSAHFPVSPIVHRTVLTAGEGETMLAEKLENFENALPQNVKLAYLPALGTVRLRLTAQGDNLPVLEEQIEKLKSELVEIIPTVVAGFETDTMPVVIGRLLKERNLVLATAESCTGGYLSHLLTSVSGSSAYFAGGIVAYSNALKMSQLGVPAEILDTHGAVSEETVKAMVRGAVKSYKADIAVAVSGVAGPTGGTAEKPVGTVWLCVGDGDNFLTAKLGIDRGRVKNIEYAANGALNLVRKFLLQSTTAAKKL
jgi:nicotinamide-nucleotide amidase